MSRGDPARETLLSVASPSADSLSSSLLHGPRSSPSLLPSLPVSSLESLSPGGSCLVPLCDYRLSLRCAVFIVRFFLRCSLCSTVFSFVSVSSRMEQDRRAFLSLSLSLFLSHSLILSLCTPFCCFCRGSRASSSRLIVLSVALGPIRIFITHFSPRHSFSEEAPCSVRTRTSHPLLFFVLDSFYPLSSLRTTAAAAVAAVSRMILSIFVVVVASVSHVKRRVSAFVGSPVSLPFSRSTPFFGHSPDSRVHRVRAIARAHLSRWYLVIATLIRKTREWLATVQRSNV